MVIGDREVALDRRVLAAEEAPAAARLGRRARGVARPASPTRRRAFARTTARRRCRSSSSRASPTRSSRSSRRASSSSRSTTSRSAPTRARASRACSPRCGPTSAATRSRSSASTPSTSRCACSSPSRRCCCSAALGVWTVFIVAYVKGKGAGHVQSLILGAVLFNAGVVVAALGRDRRPAERAADDDPAHPRARAPHRAGARHRAVALRARGRRAPLDAASAGTRRDAGRGARPVTAVTRAADGTVTGNTYDKYGTRNPVARLLQRGFERNLDDLFARREPRSLLDVGCGEGVLTQRWARELAPRRVVGIDLDDPLIAAEWAAPRRAQPDLHRPARRAAAVRRRRVRPGDRDRGARARPRPRAHARRDGALRRSATCSCRSRASRSGARSTWRAAPTGATLGNTPGHVNHFSKAAIVALCARHGEVIETRSPFPWTMVLVRV